MSRPTDIPQKPTGDIPDDMNPSTAPRAGKLAQKIKTPELIVLALAVLAACLFYTLRFEPDHAIDWYRVYRPAAGLFIRGQNPYVELNTPDTTLWFFNPPWTLLPIIPTAFMPDLAGRVYMLVVSVLSVWYVSHRLGSSPLGQALILFSLPMSSLLEFGQVEWLVLLGLVVPGRALGLLFLAVKPQVAGLVGLLWAYEAYREEGLKGALRLIAPVTGAYLISFVLYGPWLLDLLNASEVGFNLGLFPYLIPLGLWLFWRGLKGRDSLLAMRASPFVAPYCTLPSFIGFMVSFARSDKALLTLFVVSWAVVWGLRYFSPLL